MEKVCWVKMHLLIGSVSHLSGLVANVVFREDAAVFAKRLGAVLADDGDLDA